jgi:AraC family transcriptional regulator
MEYQGSRTRRITPDKEGSGRAEQHSIRDSDRRQPGASPPTFRFSPSNMVRRRASVWTGIFAETFEITRLVPFEFATTSPFPRLIVSERGERFDGETFIEGMPKSTLRDYSRRLCLVPAGYRFSGWQTPRVFNRAIYLHIDPDGPLLEPELRFSEIEFRPRLFFEDRDLWETALKLKTQIEKPGSNTYAEALGVVLAHELLRLNGIDIGERAPHGGLAGWQQKRLVEYIAVHLDKDISLIDLADVAKLSPYHFARAFKHSFGEPPHRYLMSRRIERAKTLLENPAASVTEIAIAVGFADPTSFASAFRRSVGTTPTNYRRGIK